MPRLSDMARPHPPTHLDPQRTWVVLVGILDYARQGFATRGQQDLVLDQTLGT